MSMKGPIHAIEILRDRLETGWSPQADEIDHDVPQIDALNWCWSDDGQSISYQTVDRDRRASAEIICVDRHMTYALAVDALLWLYDEEESEKIRYLGG
jgi:hypothetical protein